MAASRARVAEAARARWFGASDGPGSQSRCVRGANSVPCPAVANVTAQLGRARKLQSRVVPVRSGPMKKKRRFVVIATTVVVTALVVILGLNFVPTEKQIERHLAHNYNLDAPQFMREMGALLGPTILPGNRVEDLENGVEIFPAMLEAIRGAKES